MVSLVPKVYCGIKEKGRREGKAAGITAPEIRRIVLNGDGGNGARRPRQARRLLRIPRPRLLK